MNKRMAEYCDIVMQSAYNSINPVAQTNVSIKDKITKEDWQNAIDVIKAEYGYVDSLTLNPYIVKLNPIGKAFLANGNSFVKLVELEAIKLEEDIKKQKDVEGKFQLDFLQAKRQVKWFYPLLLVSLIGCIGTIIGIWNTVRIKSGENHLETIDKSISHFYQKEKVDSIRAWQIDTLKKQNTKKE
jgi:hypothetical protein